MVAPHGAVPGGGEAVVHPAQQEQPPRAAEDGSGAGGEGGEMPAVRVLPPQQQQQAQALAPVAHQRKPRTLQQQQEQQAAPQHAHPPAQQQQAAGCVCSQVVRGRAWLIELSIRLGQMMILWWLCACEQLMLTANPAFKCLRCGGICTWRVEVAHAVAAIGRGAFQLIGGSVCVGEVTSWTRPLRKHAIDGLEQLTCCWRKCPVVVRAVLLPRHLEGAGSLRRSCGRRRVREACGSVAHAIRQDAGSR